MFICSCLQHTPFGESLSSEHTALVLTQIIVSHNVSGDLIHCSRGWSSVFVFALDLSNVACIAVCHVFQHLLFGCSCRGHIDLDCAGSLFPVRRLALIDLPSAVAMSDT